MVITILKYDPHNIHKVSQRTFLNAKNRAGTYVYLENDRIRKICSELDRNIDTIKQVGCTQIDNLPILQIILIDADQRKLLETRKKLLECNYIIQELKN